jgi:hypothetical protein
MIYILATRSDLQKEVEKIAWVWIHEEKETAHGKSLQ